MDRFVWSKLGEDVGQIVCRTPGVCLYDGEQQTAFENGLLEISELKIVWTDAEDPNCKLALNLGLIVSMDRVSKSFTKSAKIAIKLSPTPLEMQNLGPVQYSTSHYVRLSFRKGGESDAFKAIQDVLERKSWQKVTALPGRTIRTGIVGIERKIQEDSSRTSHNISAAFEDLSKLMGMAKDMVKLSKGISEKIRSKQGDITEDETIRFKSYLLSLGIDDPVTKSEFGSGDQYHRELARELTKALEKPLKECGGVMSLTDVYCRINRARGLELISPEDLVNACRVLNSLGLSVRYHRFDSGVMVLQLASFNSEKAAEETALRVEQAKTLSADELSNQIGIPVILAKERLLHAEQLGRLCRDETVEGLRFYPNLFLNPPV